MSDHFYDLFFELQEIYMLAADATLENWEAHCELIRTKIWKLLNEKNNKS